MAWRPDGATAGVHAITATASAAVAVAAVLVGCRGATASNDEPETATVRYGTVGTGETCGLRGVSTDAPTELECVSGSCGRMQKGVPQADAALYAHNTYGICLPPCGAG